MRDRLHSMPGPSGRNLGAARLFGKRRIAIDVPRINKARTLSSELWLA
jgi:hypothetical protein